MIVDKRCHFYCPIFILLPQLFDELFWVIDPLQNLWISLFSQFQVIQVEKPLGLRARPTGYITYDVMCSTYKFVRLVVVAIW